jgi:hypothetical protein
MTFRFYLFMNPKIIAQKTPQTTRNTNPRTIITGSDNFPFFLAVVGVPCGTTPPTGGGGVAGAAVPLKEKVFPSIIGRAGVFVRAFSAGVAIVGGVGISGIPAGGA